MCVCPPRVSVSPSPLGVEKLNPSVLQSQIPWGFPIPVPEPQVGKPAFGSRTFAASLVLLFSSLWVVHLEDMGFDFYHGFPLSYLLIEASLLSLNTGYLFLGEGFQHPPVDGCSTPRCNFGVLTGEDEHTSFYSTILMDHSMDMCVIVTQLCLTLCDPMGCSLTGSTGHGILQARILEWPCQEEGDLPDPGIEPGSPALQADALLSEV